MKTKILKLECGCELHKVEIEEFKVDGEKFIGISVYEHKSMNTGKLLKKPKLLGDVILHPDQAKKLKEWIKDE